MTKKQWLIYVILPLIGVWTADRITKTIALDLNTVETLGSIGFALYHNHGAMLGLFSNLPEVLRIVSLSTGGTFLIFTFFIIQYLLPTQSLALRLGLSVLLGAILGNITDRIIWGYVVDFIFIKLDFLKIIFPYFSAKTTPAFNVSDVCQWIGYILVIFGLIKHGNTLWPKDNLRESYWVNKKFQISYCLKLVSFGLGFGIIAGTYSYTFLKVVINNVAVVHADLAEKQFLIPFISTFFVITLIFCILLFLFGTILSHRLAGPLYAFEMFLEDLIAGKPRPLKLRSSDDFTHLEELANKLKKKIQISETEQSKRHKKTKKV